jgi:hypothetical protein
MQTTCKSPIPPQIKVSELEGLFQLLRGDVEALFMQVGGGGRAIAIVNAIPHHRFFINGRRQSTSSGVAEVAPSCLPKPQPPQPPPPPQTQAPTVDLDALGLQLGDAEQLIDEQGSAVQVGLRSRRWLAVSTTTLLAA